MVSSALSWTIECGIVFYTLLNSESRMVSSALPWTRECRIVATPLLDEESSMASSASLGRRSVGLGPPLS